jgi:hypothetical protein
MTVLQIAVINLKKTMKVLCALYMLHSIVSYVICTSESIKIPLFEMKDQKFSGERAQHIFPNSFPSGRGTLPPTPFGASILGPWTLSGHYQLFTNDMAHGL